MWFRVVPTLQEKYAAGPGDPLVVNSYISTRSNNSRFYGKFSETAASFYDLLMLQKVVTCNRIHYQDKAL